MAKPYNFTQEYLRQALDYDPESGKLFWRERPVEHFISEKGWRCWNPHYAGKEALTAISKEGYKFGTISHVPVYAHRVIWHWLYGEIPDHIDHENRDRADNRKDNLVNGTSQQNSRNMKKPSNNTSGIVGVCFNRQNGKWRARIGTRILGDFTDIEQAAAARLIAEREEGYHPNHGR